MKWYRVYNFLLGERDVSINDLNYKKGEDYYNFLQTINPNLNPGSVFHKKKIL